MQAASCSTAPDHVSLTVAPSASRSAFKPVSAAMSDAESLSVARLTVADHGPAPVAAFLRTRAQ